MSEVTGQAVPADGERELGPQAVSKSLPGWFGHRLAGFGRSFRKQPRGINWARIIAVVATTVLLAGLVGVFHTLVAGGTPVSTWPARGGFFGFVGNLWPYVVVAFDSDLGVFKGFQVLTPSGTWWQVIPMWFVATAFVASLVARARSGQLASTPRTMMRRLAVALRTARSELWYGVGLGLLVAFLGFNPVTVVVLALWALVAMGGSAPGGPYTFFLQARMDANRLRRRDLGVGLRSVLGFTGGCVAGLWAGMVMVLFVWFAFEYALWARLVFLVGPAVAAVVLGRLGARTSPESEVAA